MASGNVLATLHPYANEPPGSNYAIADVRNGHPVLAFDDTTSWAAIWTFVLPDNYGGGGLSVEVESAAASATSGTHAWTGEIERMDNSSTDFDADSFAGAQSSANTNVPATSGQTIKQTIAFTSGANMDNAVAGDTVRLRLKRDVATDNAVGNAQVVMVRVKET